MAARETSYPGYTRATQQLYATQSELLSAQRALEDNKCLLQVLAGLIAHQEQLQQILEQHDRRAEQCTGTLMGEGTPCILQSANEQLQLHIGAPVEQNTGLLPAQQQYSSAPAPSSACEGGTAQAPAVDNSSSYVLGLLASASPQDVQEAGSLTVEDLQEWHVRLFENISPLLELAKREQQPTSTQQHSRAYNAAAAAETAMCAGQPGIGDCDAQPTQQTSSSSSSQHSEQPHSSAATPAPAEEAQQVLTHSTAAGLAGEADGAGAAASCLEAKQQLEYCVDAAVRVIALLMLHSPVTSNAVAATNLVSNTQAAAPPQHWLMVARRLALSQHQQQQMAQALRAYARMSRAAADEGSRVLHGMAGLSISRVLEGCSGSSSSDCWLLPARSVSATTGLAAAVSQDGCDAAAVAGHASVAAAASSASAQTAAGAAAVAAAGADSTGSGDGLAQIAAINGQLQRYMRMRDIQTVCITFFLLDRMSKLQIAEAIVASFPFSPLMLAIAEAAETEQQRYQQALQQQFRERLGHQPQPPRRGRPRKRHTA